jgi:hypothetical protein
MMFLIAVGLKIAIPAQAGIYADSGSPNAVFADEKFAAILSREERAACFPV